jgi:hypothetical protein
VILGCVISVTMNDLPLVALAAEDVRGAQPISSNGSIRADGLVALVRDGKCDVTAYVGRDEFQVVGVAYGEGLRPPSENLFTARGGSGTRDGSDLQGDGRLPPSEHVRLR